MQTNKVLRQKLAAITAMVDIIYRTAHRDRADLIYALYQKVHEDYVAPGVQAAPPENRPDQIIPPFNFNNAGNGPPADYVHYVDVDGQYRRVAVAGFRRDNNGNQ